MKSEWQTRRSQLNHDWLKNVYINSVKAFLLRLDQYPVNTARVEEFMKEDLPEWEQRQCEISKLVWDAEDAMSPRSLFKTYPLSVATDETKVWLPDLVHNLWLCRYPILQLINNARAALENANRKYQDFSNIMSCCESECEHIERETKLASCKAFIVALSELTEAISALPHEIWVV